MCHQLATTYVVVVDSPKLIDIDECAENNGGCEQTCINKPGSYECSCEPGLQIDTLNGHTCIAYLLHKTTKLSLIGYSML
uniref:EGF-like domain-containing protein n=1 Tax=Anopheles christyi TaxID=43041 RepID=A0A182JP88_9DIPT